MGEELAPSLPTVAISSSSAYYAMIIAQETTKDLDLTATKSAPANSETMASSAESMSMEEEVGIPGTSEMASMTMVCSEDAKLSTAVEDVRSGDSSFIPNVSVDTLLLDAVSADLHLRIAPLME